MYSTQRNGAHGSDHGAPRYGMPWRLAWFTSSVRTWCHFWWEWHKSVYWNFLYKYKIINKKIAPSFLYSSHTWQTALCSFQSRLEYYFIWKSFIRVIGLLPWPFWRSSLSANSFLSSGKQLLLFYVGKAERICFCKSFYSIFLLPFHVMAAAERRKEYFSFPEHSFYCSVW